MDKVTGPLSVIKYLFVWLVNSLLNITFWNYFLTAINRFSFSVSSCDKKNLTFVIISYTFIKIVKEISWTRLIKLYIKWQLMSDPIYMWMCLWFGERVWIEDFSDIDSFVKKTPLVESFSVFLTKACWNFVKMFDVI